MLGMLFAPYNKEDGRECTYYERSAIAEEDDGGDGETTAPRHACARRSAGRLRLPGRIVRLLLFRSRDKLHLDNQWCFIKTYGDCLDRENIDFNSSNLCAY
jgi:hypothetical protein